MNQEVSHEGEIAKLRREVEDLRKRLTVIERVDDALEEAILMKWPVSRTMTYILPGALELLEAKAIFVRTFDERQDVVDFVLPEAADFGRLDLDAACEQIRAQNTWHHHLPVEDTHYFGYRLDVTDMYLGSVVISAHGPLDEHERRARAGALRAWGEQLDNYMAAVSDARRKHVAMQQLSDALRVSILDVGLDRAIEVLREYLPFEDLTLALMYEESQDRSAINYRVLRSGHDTITSLRPGASADADRNAAFGMLEGDDSEFIERFGLGEERASAVIRAADGATVVGRVTVGAKPEDLNPFALDILDRFADYIRQRVVDFNKEWKRLSHNFPQPVVRRLLLQDDYFTQYLSARERDVAIMYCDISGFTRISEQILKEPSLIGELIDTWGNQVVEFIWDSGGVFDKMVGDCIIGIWGPPFFELTPQQACERAAQAARQIRAYTATLPSAPNLEQLADMDPPIGVATGLNFCPLFVGTFGPDENYTGFSSGMNNTARLQGLATRDEILCMDSFKRVLGGDTKFGERREARVKNVAEPIEFYELS